MVGKISGYVLEGELTIAVECGTTRRMGRPPLKRNVKTIVMALRLPADVAARIDALAGPNKRAEFIREAIEAELDRREREKPS